MRATYGKPSAVASRAAKSDTSFGDRSDGMAVTHVGKGSGFHCSRIFSTAALSSSSSNSLPEYFAFLNVLAPAGVAVIAKGPARFETLLERGSLLFGRGTGPPATFCAAR